MRRFKCVEHGLHYDHYANVQQAILKEANEKTLSEVTEFLQDYGSK